MNEGRERRNQLRRKRDGDGKRKERMEDREGGKGGTQDGRTDGRTGPGWNGGHIQSVETVGVGDRRSEGEKDHRMGKGGE